MRRIAVVLLLLSAYLFAETQEAAYFRAMQAEESGDISLAIKMFEEALSIGGDYSAEIAEILNDYYDALGLPPSQRKSLGNHKNVEQISPWSYRFLGELGAVGLRYSASRSDTKWGLNLQGAFSSYLDYDRGNVVHSLGVNLLGDANFYNDDMPALDTNDWKGSVGLEYSLIADRLLWNVGVDLNIYQQENVSPSFYTWLEYSFYKENKQSVGAALWGYYDAVGPMSIALYGFWRKNFDRLHISVMAGPRFDVDSVFDYHAYRQSYDAALDAIDQEMDNYSGYQYGTNPFEQCLELYGEQCYSWDIAAIDSLNWVNQYQKLLSEIQVVTTKYWAKWFGPSLKIKARYQMGKGFSLEGKTSLFYSFVIDGPGTYEDISKLNAVFTGSLNWNVGMTELYGTVEDSYKLYCLPTDYEKVYPKHTNILKFKIGSKWNF